MLSVDDLAVLVRRPQRVALLERVRLSVAWAPGVEEAREAARRLLPPCVRIT